MTSATIKLFLARGDAKSLRTAEISNWTGKAIAAPRTEFDELLAREELDRAGVYILIGSDPQTNLPGAYIGEAEVVRERLKQHRTREFSSAIVFVSKDENLTKAHVRYLESRILAEAARVDRFKLEQNQAGGSRLPESDRFYSAILARTRLGHSDTCSKNLPESGPIGFVDLQKQGRGSKRSANCMWVCQRPASCSSRATPRC